MRLRLRSLFALAIPVVIAVGLACNGSYGDPCTSLGGSCVTNMTQCGGSLPYACTVGFCCLPNGASAPDGATTGDSSSSTMLGNDASTSVNTGDAATPGDDGSSAEASASTPDAAPPADGGEGDDASVDAASPSPDASADAAVLDAMTSQDAGHDASTHDASSHDSATPDAHAAKDGAVSLDAGPGCASYAAPSTTALCLGCANANPPVAPASCQKNGCFGGYYCRLTNPLDLACVKPASVACDGG
jgi:hypothetical protein